MFAARAWRRRISARSRPPTPHGSNDWRSASAFSAVSIEHGTAAQTSSSVTRRQPSGSTFPIRNPQASRTPGGASETPSCSVRCGSRPGRRVGPVFERELLGLLAHPGRRRRAVHVVAEVGLEVDVRERVLHRLGRRRLDDRFGSGRLGRARRRVPARRRRPRRRRRRSRARSPGVSASSRSRVSAAPESSSGVRRRSRGPAPREPGSRRAPGSRRPAARGASSAAA